MKKHPNCCIVHHKSALEQALALHKNSNQTITLAIFADNNINQKKKCLDWSLETAGKELGHLVKVHPCIGHLNLFTCYSGTLDEAQIQDATFFEKSEGPQDLSRSLSIYPHNSRPDKNPFAPNTIAYQISQVLFPAIHQNERGPVVLSIAPRYLHNQEAHFIGSSEGIPYVAHGFSKSEHPLLHYKRISTFIGNPLLFQGVCQSKNNTQKNSHIKVVIDEQNNNRLPSPNEQHLTYSFFKPETPTPESGEDSKTASYRT